MRLRRHTGRADPLVSRQSWRRFLRDLALVAAVFVLGYLISAVWISPAPLFGSADQAVPDVIGSSEAAALDEIQKVGLRPRVSGTRAHPTKGAGTVLWQDPPSGVIMSPNSTVTLVLSGGATGVPVPDVVGLDTATARDILTAAGVTVGEISFIASGPEAGIVIATRPSVGAARPRGSAVSLVVSRAPARSRAQEELP